ncbi:hypothetical protein QI302_02245 [Staphylococcus saprophyticus]|mgnify:FL=1|nr:hypothetical protein [Staphylococcus saprophyticus]MDW4219828.1 hypothetical protein [Staphylococcus saprophyticus]MDW4338237.1 hypothetical protein [Staphylococcus saprophyticus]
MQYRNSDNTWVKFDKRIIKQVHDDMYYYRALYEGRHHELFPRAVNLIEQGEIIDVYSTQNEIASKNVRTPYLMINISRVIIDLPSMLVARTLNAIKTNYPNNSLAQQDMLDKTQQATVDTQTQEHFIEQTETNDFNGQTTDKQQEVIDQIKKNSNINHTMNLNQLQIDGGIVAVPMIKNGKIAIDIKERNVYFPHDDNLGVDLVYELEPTQEEEENGVRYVHVYTERESEEAIETLDRLYKSNDENNLVLVEEPELIREKLQIDVADAHKVFRGRQRTFVSYLANDPTFTNKLGNSALRGIAGKQEEINWTVTRTAQTFERNGKPRISIPKGTMEQLKAIALDKFGDENKIDHRNLEVTEIDENGQSMEIHQIDTSKIGDMNYVKDIIRMMLAETQTSESAIELVKQQSSGTQSGIAKFYDLMLSVIKSEKIRDDYVEFLQNAFESALWFAHDKDDEIIIERPNIIVKDMLPKPQEEVSTENIAKYNAGVQSLEETIRRINPEKSEEWLQEEIERIQSNQTQSDSMSLDLGNQSLQNFMNNRDDNGNPLDEFGNPIESNEQNINESNVNE